MAASGVRSSWFASETNLRILAFVSSSSWKLCSMRLSIMLSEADRPHLRGSGSVGTRCERSPAAILLAVRLISRNGRRLEG